MHRTVLQRAENIQHMHSDILAASQFIVSTLLSDISTVLPNRPVPVLYEPTLLPNRSTMEPN